MQLSILTDGLDPQWETMLDTVQRLGYQAVELATGNWSDAPHVDLDGLLASAVARETYLDALRRRGMTIAALNCSGNQLAPGECGRQHEEVVQKTFRLAELLGVHKIVMMSGLPGAGPRDEYPNWIVSSWPAENMQILDYQWAVALEYWHKAVNRAQSYGIDCIALENHGCQLVYNCETMLRLRAEVGPLVGMNVDPSHLFWMGGDPQAVLRCLGPAVHHIHAKDARVEAVPCGQNTRLDAKSIDCLGQRSWNFAAVGSGHDLQWWKAFFAQARMIGYDGAVSLELEDVSMTAQQNLEKSTEILRQALV